MQRTPGIIGLAALVGALLMCSPVALPQDIKAAAQPDSSRRRVLVLNSYHPGYLWSDDLVAGIRSILDDGRTDIFIEYLDSKRFVGKEYFDRIEETIRHKHRSAKIDAIIASDHNAVELILKMRSTFHRGVPLVFCGIDKFSWEHRVEYEPICGLEEKDGGVFGTLDLVFSVHPRLRAVYFVADETKSAQVMLKYVREAEASQKDGVKFNYMVGMSVAEVETAVREVPADSVVMWLHFVADKNGRVLDVTESQQWLAEHSPVPVYCPWGFKAGTGVLGGRILSGFTQGKKAAEIVRQILEKRDPQPIPYGQQAPLTTMFDYEVMRRFGIGMEDIPADSIVHRRPLSALEKYKWQISGIVALVVVLSLLVGFLLIERVRHRRARGHLEVTEGKYRSVVEHANETIVVTQGETVKYCNPQVSELSGYTPEEIRSQSFVEFIHPEDREMVLREYQARLSGESPAGSYSTRIITKDGHVKYVFINSALIDLEGKPASLSMITDITERKRMEEELKKSEHDKSLILNSTSEIIAFHDLDHNFQWVNKAYLDTTGLSISKVIGKKCYHVWGLDRLCTNCPVSKALETGESHEAELTPQNQEHWPPDQGCWAIRATPVKNDDGSVIGAIEVAYDITERKIAQEELVKSEERFRRLMEESPLDIAILNPEGQITEVNTAWMRLWGLNKEETAQVLAKYNMLTDKQFHELGIGPLVERAFAGERVVLPPIEYSGNLAVDEMGLEGIETRSRWIQCHLYPVKDENGDIAYVVNTNTDITELKRTEQEAREQRDALARVDRATRMGQLTGSISHELNQPLTGILSNAQAGELMIKKGKWERDELARIMTDIAADTKRMGDVIRNLRELYREQKGEFLPFDINAVVNETTQLLNSEFVTQHIVLTTECTPSIPMVNGNKVQIEQVLVNLIMNGIQAMSGAARNDRRLHIATAYDANEVKVWVEDCGTGIDADKIDRIFEPLATWKPGGTGMGLAISNSIIEAHGGKMWAENRPEGGARVGSTLPVLKEGKKA